MFPKIGVIAVMMSLLLCPYVHGAPSPENGVLREKYPNGRIRLETVFKKGRVVRSRTYYQNGNLMSEFRYKTGALLRSRTFYENGVLRSEWSRKTKIMKFYSPTGFLTHQTQLDY